MDDFNDLFGEAREPGGDGLRPGEKDNRPKSLALVARGDVGSEALIGHMRAVQNGCRITGYLCESSTILWLVDEEGFLRVAVEEAVDPEQQAISVPILRKMKGASAHWWKLGHPALLDDGGRKGRIGGEMRFASNGRWEINNLSGRYGLRCSRVAAHLENAADYFRSFGLEIDTDFIG